MDLGLKGKVALVTGGARDVGREISLLLGAEGATVAVDYLHAKAEAEATVAEIRQRGGRAAAYACDVADYQAVTGLVNDVVYGVLNCCHAVAPGMIEQKSGRIINIVGDSARVGQPRLSITAAARGGVITLGKTLARELGRANVTVNTLALGYVETAHSDQAWLSANRDKILAFYPIRRLGRPSDVAPFVAFLASEHAAWVTGQTISVSGGYTTVG